MTHSLRLYRTIARFVARLRADDRGNILMITGLSIIPLLFVTGFGIDYSKAEKLQTKLNAAADAAALTAVTATMMQQDAGTAKSTAQQMFIDQASNLSGLVFTPGTDLVVNVSSTGSLNTGRAVTVTYKAKSTNSFTAILGVSTLAISGTASAQAQGAPNINFYLMLDDSPSMLLPSTSNGLSNIQTATTNSHNSEGCDFACHVQNPHGDAIYVQNAAGQDIFLNSNYYASSSATTGYQTWYALDSGAGNLYTSANVLAAKSCTSSITAITCAKSASGAVAATVIKGLFADGYWLTRNYGNLYKNGTTIPLRIDDEATAAKDLIPFAQGQASANKVTYNMQLFSFYWTHPGYSNPNTALTASMANVNSLSTSSVPDLYASQDYWASNNCPSSTLCNNDQGSEFFNMFTAMNTTMPTPGDGSTVKNPQEVLFLVTDGLTDENTGGGRRNREFSGYGTGTPAAGTDMAACNAIKARGIKIAILYTEYLPESLANNGWSQSNVAPYLPNVAPALQQCASQGTDGTPLFYQVTTDQSISNALTALFSLAIQSAHLTT